MEAEANEILRRVDRYRRLAQQMPDPEAAKALQALADRDEAVVRQLEAQAPKAARGAESAFQ